MAATKCDQPVRKVFDKEGREWAAAHGFPFFEVSAASGQGVRALFQSLFARILATVPGIPEDLVAQAVAQAAQARDEEGLSAAQPAAG